MAGQVGAIDVQVDALITKGLLHDLPTEEALMIFEQAIELAESAGLLYHAARAHNNLATISTYRAGDLASGVKHYQLAAEIARKMGAVSNELFFAINAATIEIFQGKLRSAENRLVSLKILMEETHDPGPSELNLKSAEAALLRYQGEFEEAIRKYREQRHEAQTVGDLQILCGIDLYLGEILVEVGEVSEAEVVLLEAVELFDRIVALGGCATRSMLSMSKIQQGLFKEAHRWLREAREKENELGLGFIDTFYRLIAERRLAVAERDWPKAWTAFEEFMERIEKSGFRWFRAQALREWAEAHLTRGEPGDEERARELLLESQAEFEEMGAPIYAAQAKEILSGLDKN